MPGLPIIPLQHPTVLLPGIRISLSFDVEIGRQLETFVHDSNGVAVVAAVPLVPDNSTVSESPKLKFSKSGGRKVTDEDESESGSEDAGQSAKKFKLNEWGCAASITRIIRPSALNRTDEYVVTIHGLRRIRLPKPYLLDPNHSESLTYHPIENPPKETRPKEESVRAFKNAALRLLDKLVQDSTNSTTGIGPTGSGLGSGPRRAALTRLAMMVEETPNSRMPWLADVMIWSIITEYEDRLAFLAEYKTDDRLVRAAELFQKQMTLNEVSQKIANAVDESLSKQQKEFILRQQLAAIQRELAALNGRSSNSPFGSGLGGVGGDGGIGDLEGEDTAADDDMKETKKKIEAMQRGSEERKMAVREWRRLKRMPAQFADSAVVRNYLEWLTSLPWPTENAEPSDSAKAMRDRNFIPRARQQLDEDHYGLDKVKRRLIEYLAIIRLHQLAADAEQKAEEERQANLSTVQEVEVDAKQRDAEATKAGRKKQEDRIEGKKDESKALVIRSKSKADRGRKLKEEAIPSPGPPKAPIKRPKNAIKGPILLFVGPPGTGKTSLGQSIARALDRPFQRISLGGVRDEAEIRGHRRTYVGSGPGLIAQALRKAGRADLVLLLDEIDKVGPSNYHGDVGSALLEVLDPEQNHSFNDHYINVPIDLSQVLFICTANTLDTISAPLLDRCEIVHLAGYTHAEKEHIARRFLLPKQLKANALDASRVEISDNVLSAIVTQYTREAGVRSLERAIGAVVRAKAVQYSEAVDTGKEGEYNPKVEESDLEAILGVPRVDVEEKEREAKRGVVYGLVVTGLGEGGILAVETTAVPGSGKLKLTGSLGEVIKESGELALSWVKTNAYLLNITSTPAQDPLKVPDPIDIHLHLPAGAQKKDGPSAGVAMVCAFVSLLTGALVPADVAMTGEITLRGRVTPVGGIKEKILGAHRANITRVILPQANLKDVEHDVPREVRDAMDFVFVRTVEEALDAAFGKGVLMWKRGARNGSMHVESRL